MDAKQPNKYGVYEEINCDRLAIPLSKKLKSGLLISVVRASDNLWRFGFSCAIKTSGQSSPVCDNGLIFKTREEAIIAGVNKLSAIVSSHRDLTKTEIKIYMDAINEFSLGFPISEEAPAPPVEQPPQAEKPRPVKLAYIFGWMSAETSIQRPAQLYVERVRGDWGVSYDPSDAARFKSVDAILDYYRKIGTVHGDPETNIYNGFLMIFEDGPFGRRPVPKLTRQTALFDNLPPLEIVEKQPDLITSTCSTADQFSRDEAKLIAAGFVLVKYDREAKSIQQTYIEGGKGWAPSITFSTYAAAERTLKEALKQENVVEVTLDGHANYSSCGRKLFTAGFDFYRTEGIIPGHGDIPRIKQGSKNWGTWGKYEQPFELKNAWDELMKDPKALHG